MTRIAPLLTAATLALTGLTLVGCQNDQNNPANDPAVMRGGAGGPGGYHSTSSEQNVGSRSSHGLYGGTESEAGTATGGVDKTGSGGTVIPSTPYTQTTPANNGTGSSATGVGAGNANGTAGMNGGTGGTAGGTAAGSGTANGGDNGGGSTARSSNTLNNTGTSQQNAGGGTAPGATGNIAPDNGAAGYNRTNAQQNNQANTPGADNSGQTSTTPLGK